MERTKVIFENRLSELNQIQNLEIEIAKKLGFSEFRVGGQVICNDKGWRINELDVDYIWTVMISRSFIGWGGLLAIKLNKNQFREINNSEKLIRCIFSKDSKDNLELYIDEIHDNVSDPVANQLCLNLFNANKGITLDGISYKMHILSLNIDSIITVNNPVTEQWRKWENEVFTLGKQLANKSKNQDLIRLFKT